MEVPKMFFEWELMSLKIEVTSQAEVMTFTKAPKWA